MTQETHTTKTVEELANELLRICNLPLSYDKQNNMPDIKPVFVRFITQAQEIARREERERIVSWVRGQVDENSGQCIHYDEILQALIPSE